MGTLIGICTYTYVPMYVTYFEVSNVSLIQIMTHLASFYYHSCMVAKSTFLKCGRCQVFYSYIFKMVSEPLIFLGSNVCFRLRISYSFVCRRYLGVMELRLLFGVGILYIFLYMNIFLVFLYAKNVSILFFFS